MAYETSKNKLAAGRCRERRGVIGHCGNKSGHGPGGEYCALHWRLREGAKGTISLWRRSQFAFAGDARVQKVMAREVTAKTFVAENGARHPLKDSGAKYYLTEEEALEAEVEHMRGRQKSMEKEARSAGAAVRRLSARLKLVYRRAAKK